MQGFLMQATQETYRVGHNTDIRHYHDTTTWLAELLPGAMRTPFEYQWDGNELYAADGGSLGVVFNDALEHAENLPAYERRRRAIEKAEYLDMCAMMRGELPNTLVVQSDFPPELMTAVEDEGGYDVRRKQTMLRVITKTKQGTLKMYSQSLDGSNRGGLEAIRSFMGYKAQSGELLGQRMSAELDETHQEFLIDNLTNVYDRSLQLQYGGEWYAGQQGKKRINTYDFVCQQDDLLTSYLAVKRQIDGDFTDYSLAAEMRDRYEGKSRRPRLQFVPGGIVGHEIVLQQMYAAGHAAEERGEVFSGCGTTSRGVSLDGMNAVDQLEHAGYGNKMESPKLPDDKYGSRYFKCPKGHTNVRQKKNQLIEHCQVCKCNVRCA